MRLYSDPKSNFFFIETVSEGPVSDFIAVSQGDLVSVYRPMRGVYDLKNVHFAHLQDKDGNGFISGEAASNYINDQLKFHDPFADLKAVYPLSFDTGEKQLTVAVDFITDGGNI